LSVLGVELPVSDDDELEEFPELELPDELGGLDELEELDALEELDELDSSEDLPSEFLESCPNLLCPEGER